MHLFIFLLAITFFFICPLVSSLSFSSHIFLYIIFSFYLKKTAEEKKIGHWTTHTHTLSSYKSTKETTFLNHLWSINSFGSVLCFEKESKSWSKFVIYISPLSNFSVRYSIHVKEILVLIWRFCYYILPFICWILTVMSYLTCFSSLFCIVCFLWHLGYIHQENCLLWFPDLSLTL